MTYLINMDQLCQHLPPIVDATLDGAYRDAPRSRYLLHRVAFGGIDEGGDRHTLAPVNGCEYVPDNGTLVCLLSPRLVPITEILGEP